MSKIPDETIEQVRDSVDLVALIGESVALKRTGADYRGPCPFHGGTHRNFAVIPKKGLFYCYVCHEGGDAFSYLMKRFGMDYPTAVRELARRSGIVIPERSAAEGPDPRAPLYQAVAAAQEWFARQLQESKEAKAARDYLASRELTLEAAADFGLGFAPRRGELLAAMEALGIPTGVLVAAGLVVRREDGDTHARFRGRLVFPIADLRGRPIGFGGRLLGPGEPKYLNSPETDLFQKGRLLYHLDRAKHAIRKAEEALVVEGYFDVVRLVLAGVEHVVAPLGTALTPEQARLLRRYAPAVVLLYDSDAAGLRATFRAADTLLRHDVRVRVATLPDGEDPDSLVRRGGAAALTAVVGESMDVLERKIQLLERKGWFEGLEHRRDAVDRLLPTIRATANPITRELYLSRVAERTGVRKEILADEARESPGGPAPSRPTTPAGGPERRPRGAGSRAARVGEAAERELVRVLLDSPLLRSRAREAVDLAWLEHPVYREIAGALLAVEKADDAADVYEELSEPARAAWERLKATAGELSAQAVDEIFVGACQALEARPLFRDFERMTDVAEKRRQRDLLMERFPEVWTQRYGWRRARRDGPG